MKSLPIEQILVFGNMPARVFNKTIEWKRARYNALNLHGNSCQLCGTNPTKGGVQMHVDHIKPRFLYPELCLEHSNLQVLCDVCHTAKGVEYIDDCRGRVTQAMPVLLSEVLQLKPKHVALQYQFPRTRHEAKYFGEEVISDSKKDRQRWRTFATFLFRRRLLYNEAIEITVGQIYEIYPNDQNKIRKFLIDKDDPNSLAFTIQNCRFPVNIRDLLSEADRSDFAKACRVYPENSEAENA